MRKSVPNISHEISRFRIVQFKMLTEMESEWNYKHSDIKYAFVGIDVREGILLGGRKKFALKLTICPKNRQLALKLTFEFNPNGAWNLM